MSMLQAAHRRLAGAAPASANACAGRSYGEAIAAPFPSIPL
jgi:hypothetical protein